MNFEELYLTSIESQYTAFFNMSIYQPQNQPKNAGQAWEESFRNADLAAQEQKDFERFTAESLANATEAEQEAAAFAESLANATEAELDAIVKRAAAAATDARQAFFTADFAACCASTNARLAWDNASFGDFLYTRRKEVADRKAAAAARTLSESHVHVFSSPEEEYMHECKHDAGDGFESHPDAWQPADADPDDMAEIARMIEQHDAHDMHEAIQRSNYTKHWDNEARASRK